MSEDGENMKKRVRSEQDDGPGQNDNDGAGVLLNRRFTIFLPKCLFLEVLKKCNLTIESSCYPKSIYILSIHTIKSKEKNFQIIIMQSCFTNHRTFLHFELNQIRRFTF